MSIRKYEYDGEVYTAEQIIKMGDRQSSEKSFRDSVDQWIISQILYQGGMPRMASKVEKIARAHQESLGRYGYSTGSERRQMKAHKRYCRKLDRFRDMSLNIHNGTSLLDELVRETLGYSDVPREGWSKDSYGHGLVDYGCLTDAQCIAIANNFKRKIKGKSTIPMAKSK